MPASDYKPMKTTHLLLYLLTSTFLSAQPDSSDSLLKVSRTMKADTSKVNLLNEIAWNLKYSDPKRSMEIVQEALALGEQKKFWPGIATSYKTMGVLMDEAGNMSKSISYYEKAIYYYRKNKDVLGVAKSEGNIGMLYRELGRDKEAIQKFESSLSLFIRKDYPVGQYLIYQNLSMCWNSLRNREKSLDYIKKAYTVMKSLGMEDPTVYGNMGTAYMDTDDQQAVFYLKKAIEICNATNNGHTSSSWLSNLAFLYRKQKKYDEAIRLYKQSIEMAPNKYESNSMKTHQGLAQTYAAVRNFEDAYTYLTGYTNIKDSLFSLETNKQLSELTKKYDTEKKQLQIMALKQQRSVQNKQLKSEQQQKYVYAGVMVVFLFLGVSLFSSLRQKSKSNKIILEQKEQVEKQKELVDEKNKEITDSITYAKRLQDAILPADAYWKSCLPESFVLYQPKDIVAGDFYWLEEITSSGEDAADLVFFAAADCTGHGVPGAMVSVVCSNALNRTVLEFGLTDPGQILDKTRDLVIETFRKSSENVQDGMDISLCCLNRKTSELKWAGANNPLWYVSPSSKELEEIKPNKQPIGNYAELKPFTTHTVQLEKETTVYLFTDGYADQFGGSNGKKYKAKQMKETLLSVAKSSMNVQKKTLEDAFASWKGVIEQIDDVCIIGVRI